MKKVSVIFGTRPEAIKLAPVILELKKQAGLVTHVCVTGQHRQMLDQVLEAFNIKPDVDLDLMTNDQTLTCFTAKALISLGEYLEEEKPDLVIVQGDTTTVLCAALAAFYQKIPFGHVEAGLRTGNMFSPWPEEANRVIVSRIASFHFAPTELNKENLIREGISESQIFITGNTVIDALFIALERIKNRPPQIEGLPGKSLDFLGNKRMILITGHRRENFGKGFENICRAIKTLSIKHPDMHFIYPVHLNPNVREPVRRILGFDKSAYEGRGSNIHLIEPQWYLGFVALMNRSFLIMTDSGGIQEEAPSLNKPLIIMRETTERREAIESGVAVLVGTKETDIVSSAELLITNSEEYSKLISGINPFGDGKSANLITKFIKELLISKEN